MDFFNKFKHLYFVVPLACGVIPCVSSAMMALEEEEMSDVSGAGLAFVMDNFSMRMAPTSYAELTGTAPTAQAAAEGWQRGDARYYGLSFTSGASTGTDWYGNGCGASADPLKCPIGTNGANDYGVTAFASVFDPFLLRVFQYEGFDYQGAWRGNAAPPGFGGTVLPMPTILEFIGPSNTDTWRWSFWGELEVGRGSPAEPFGACNNSLVGCVNGADFLQSQTIIHGKPVAIGNSWRGLSGAGVDQGYQLEANKPAILRVMQTENNADRTLGMTYQSAISGDFRFSVRQMGGSPDELHTVPDFDNDEGLHFRNVDAFLPLGTLHYQAVTFSGVTSYNPDTTPSAPQQNGNFSIELTRIQNNPYIYNHFYCGNEDGAACAPDASGAVANPNSDTHGYVRWGNWCTSATCAAVINPYTATPNDIGAYNLPTGISTANGIYYSGTPNLATNNNAIVNLGISRIEGMLIHHLKITTLGAGI